MERIHVDGKLILPISSNTYQELIRLELDNSELDSAFPVKPNTPRYLIAIDDAHWGYYKVLSKKELANNQTSILTLHKQ